MNRPPPTDYIVKVPVIGARKCGTTNLISRVCFDDYLGVPHETIGIDFSVASVVRAGKQIKIQYWDAAIPEKGGNPIRQLCAEGSIAMIFAYSITDALSLQFAQSQMLLMRKNNWIDPSTVVFLVGTKADMREDQKVDSEKAKKIAGQAGAVFMEVSAKDRTGLSQLQSQLGAIILDMAQSTEVAREDNVVKKFYNILKN